MSAQEHRQTALLAEKRQTTEELSMQRLSWIEPLEAQAEGQSARAGDTETAAACLRVVIETPRGSRVKYKFDEDLRAMAMKSVLPAGMVFPFNFGFVPRSLGGDGDPLDALVLMEEPLAPGCVVRVRLLGVMEVEQIVRGVTERNDRLLTVPDLPGLYGELRRLQDVPEGLLRQLDEFFVQYHRLQGKQSRCLATKDAKAAEAVLREAMERNLRQSRELNAAM